MAMVLHLIHLRGFSQHENDLERNNSIHVQADPKLVWDKSVAFKAMNGFRGFL